MRRATACERKNTDLRFTSITASQSSSVKSIAVGAADDAGVVDEDVDAPAAGFAASATTRSTGSSVARSACDQRGTARRRRGRPPPVSSIAERPTATMPAPASRQRDGDRLPEAGVGAGDDGRAAREVEWSHRAPHRRCVHRDHVHVREVLVVAAHRPDEGVVAGADAGMDRPARGQDRLLVRDHEVLRLVGLAHEMDHPRVGGEVEIDVDLRAAVVHVGRHGVPHAARLELRQAHDELAGSADLRVDHLVDRARVRSSPASPSSILARLGEADLHRVVAARGPAC